jgi:hypothetical protein
VLTGNPWHGQGVPKALVEAFGRAHILEHYGDTEGSQLMDIPAPARGHAIFSLKYALRV